MDITNKLSELDVKSLIQIIDDAENEETQLKRSASDELDKRKISSEELNILAIEINQKIAKDVLMKEDIGQEEVAMHKSKFLTIEEIKTIYIKQLEKFIKEKDQFRFDVWSYAIGGL